MGAVTFSLDEKLLDAITGAASFGAFVETGTYKGDTAAAAAARIARVVTVEFSEPLWLEATQRFAGQPRVEVLQGNSPEVLARVRPTLAGTPTLFWLDAHWCVAEDTSGDHSQCPLLEEIAAIGALDDGSVILIDDARLFLAPPPEPHDVTHWPTFDRIVRALHALSARHELMVVNDVIVFYPEALEQAVEGYARHHGVDWLRARQSLEENTALRAVIEEKEVAIQQQYRTLAAFNDTMAALNRQVGEKDALLQELHGALERMRGASESPAEPQPPGATAAAAAAPTPAPAPEVGDAAVLARLHKDVEQKEAVIHELQRAVAAYRAAFSALRFVIDPALRVARALRFLHNTPLRVFAPRLGNLNQHPPVALRLPPSYSSGAPPSTAPRISIVTPSYQQAAFIERTILSVLDQGYPGLEYHVQDGASTDGTREILERYADRLTSWESSPDGGQTEAINRGFARTSAEIMAWLNSDDILFPGTLAYVADFFATHPEVDVVYGHRVLIDTQDREIGRWILPSHSDEVLSWADYVPQETLFWRRSIWEKAGARVDETFRFAVDWDLLVRFRDAGARFHRLPRLIGGFRIHPKQKTSSSISDVGFREMDRIRQRALGRVPTPLEIRKAVLPYLMRHYVADLRWRIQDRIGAFQ
ncbi:MAG: glycosyltransferase family 2 protein, partial [Usitatibacter sp.]